MSHIDEQLFTTFVHRLQGRSLDHCFLRGYSLFPRVAPNSDVDMLVAPGDRAATEEAFREAAREAGFHIWQRFRSASVTRIFAYAFCSEHGHLFFDLDIHSAESSYGVTYLRADDLLPHAITVEGICRLPEPIEAMVNGLGHYFAGGAIPEKYRAPWAQHRDDERARELLCKVLGEERAQRLLSALGSPDSIPEASDVLTGGRRMGARARMRQTLRHPLSAPLGFAAFAWGERVRPWYRPRGRFLVFIGTDGSGKSTLVREVLGRVGPRFRDGVVFERHLRPGLVPQISSLFHGGKPAYTDDDQVDPHRSKPSGFVGSSLRTLYYWCDYALGYPLRILPKRGRNSLIIFDRWFYDYLVDPLRFRVAAGHPMPGFLKHFLPKPDRVLICTAPPERILERKQELGPAEVERQVAQFRGLVDQLPRASIIDTTQDVDGCVDEIIRAVFTEGAARV